MSLRDYGLVPEYTTEPTVNRYDVSRQIEEQTKLFLSAGGEITKVAPGVSGWAEYTKETLDV